MNFSESFPVLYINNTNYLINGNMYIHKTVKMGKSNNNKAYGRVFYWEFVIKLFLIVLVDYWRKYCSSFRKGQNIVWTWLLCWKRSTYLSFCILHWWEREGVRVFLTCVSLRDRRDSPLIHIGDNVLMMENASICASWIGSNVYVGKGSIIVCFYVYYYC